VSAWIAILAPLIAALLPTAVSAAAEPGAPVSIARCSAARGSPAKHDASPLIRHCAVCCSCVFGLTPSRPGMPTARLITGAAHLASILSSAPQTPRPLHSDAQPRASPRLF
jgi:hypothetical protein